MSEVEMLQGKEMNAEEKLTLNKSQIELWEGFAKKYLDFERHVVSMGLRQDAHLDQAIINFKQGMMWIKECIYLSNPIADEKPTNVQ